MKYASLKVILLVLATGGLIAACASGTETTDFSAGASGTGGSAVTSGAPDTSANTGVGGSGGVQASTTAATTGNGGAGGGGGVCIPKCNADVDCQNSCPATQTGINCCDAPSGFCYVASTAVCPMPNPATTTGSGPY